MKLTKSHLQEKPLFQSLRTMVQDLSDEEPNIRLCVRRVDITIGDDNVCYEDWTYIQIGDTEIGFALEEYQQMYDKFSPDPFDTLSFITESCIVPILGNHHTPRIRAIVEEHFLPIIERHIPFEMCPSAKEAVITQWIRAL